MSYKQECIVSISNVLIFPSLIWSFNMGLYLNYTELHTCSSPFTPESNDFTKKT